jgi:hypothetical protein
MVLQRDEKKRAENPALPIQDEPIVPHPRGEVERKSNTIHSTSLFSLAGSFPGNSMGI